jgi:CRISPR/Cas system-associated exonuclease Cas4 (RecB family)
MGMIKEALENYARASQRPWKHDRAQTIGASEIGQCARRTWFAKHQTVADAGYVDRWGAKKRGDLIEVFWEKAMRAHVGLGRLHYAGRYQRTFFDTAGHLSATPDGVVADLDKSECFLVECKSLDPRAKIERSRPEHIYQVQVQMGLVRQQTPFRPSYAILAYIDASFLDESREFRIDFDPDMFEQARARAKAIFEANGADALRPEGYIAGKAECEYCPYRRSCSTMRAAAVPSEQGQLDEEGLKQLVILAGLRSTAKAIADEGERQAKMWEDKIKEALRKAGTRRVDGEGVSVIWSALKGRPSWNWPALRAAAEEVGLDLAQFETTGDPSDRLVVDLKRDGAG